MSFCKKILALVCVFSLLCGFLIPVHADDDIDPSVETGTQDTVVPTVTDPTGETTQATETTAATEPEGTTSPTETTENAQPEETEPSSSAPTKVKKVNGFPLYNQLDYPQQAVRLRHRRHQRLRHYLPGHGCHLPHRPHLSAR